MQLQLCSGCGSRLPAVNGPIHAYMLSSPACWNAFGAVIEREYSDPRLMNVHRLTVDTWAVQHPGDGSRRAIQSVGLHLARLLVQLEQGLSETGTASAMLAFASCKAELPELPPRQSYRMTVADVVACVEPDEHRRAVLRWAEETWADWADQHDFIRDWARLANPKA